MISRPSLLVIIFLIGFSSLVYQIYSVRVLFMFFVQSTQAASIAISAFLGGIAFSSILFSRFSNRNTLNLGIIFWLQLLSAFYGYFLLSQYEIIPDFIDSLNSSGLGELSKEILKTSLIWLFLFIPAFFLGGAFSLVNGLYLSNLEDSSKDTGTVYFWDTFGAIIGAIFTGYIFIPYLGLNYTIVIPVFLNLFVCLLCTTSRKKELLTLLIILFVLIIEILLYLNIKPDFRTQKEKLEARLGKVIFQKESDFGKVTISGDDKNRILFINYREMCGSGKDNDNIGRTSATFLKPNSNAVNIGLGCGFTAVNMIDSPNIEHLDIVEINPVVFEGTSGHFKDHNDDVTNRDNVQIILQEGYEYLRNSEQKYNLITVDIEEPTIVHSSAIFKKEFFEIVSEKLTEDGVFALWSFEANQKFSRVIYNTLKAVFPYVVVEYKGLSNNFYASKELNIRMMGKESSLYKKKMFENNVTEINTIQEPRADKYYDLNKVFGLPTEYVDDFERDSAEN